MAKRRRKPKAPPAPPTNGSKPPPGKKMGRPSVVVGGDIEVFLAEVEIGTPLRPASAIAGFSRASVYNALKAGRNQEKAGKRGEGRDFLDKYRLARAKAIGHYVKIVAGGAAGDPATKRAPDTADAKFMLKVMDPARFNVEGKGKGAPEDRPISRIELAASFKLLAQAVQLEVEDSRVLMRIGERWAEIFRTLGMEDETEGVVETRQKPLPTERRLGHG